jgi:topoisomerase IA-like protein
VLSVTEISQLFDDIRKAASKKAASKKAASKKAASKKAASKKAASKKAELVMCNVALMNAGRQTEVSMSIALALQYQLKDGLP